MYYPWMKALEWASLVITFLFPARDDILNFVGQEEAATNRDALHGLSKGSPPWCTISAIRL